MTQRSVHKRVEDLSRDIAGTTDLKVPLGLRRVSSGDESMGYCDLAGTLALLESFVDLALHRCTETLKACVSDPLRAGLTAGPLGSRTVWERSRPVRAYHLGSGGSCSVDARLRSVRKTEAAQNQTRCAPHCHGCQHGDGGDLEITDDAIQYIVEEGYGFLGGNRTVVEVAGDDDGIRLRIASDLDEIIKDKRLIVGEVVPLEELTEMPI